LADFFLAVITKISQIVIIQNIRKYAFIKTLKTRLKLPKIEILTAFNKSDGVMRDLVEKNSKKRTFNERWGWISHKYPLLDMFSGGFQTVFPGTSTVEWDFRNTIIEKK